MTLVAEAKRPRERFRIGLNVLYVIPGEVGGTEVYARELIAAIAGSTTDEIELVVFVNREARDWPLPPEARRVVCPVSGRRRWQRYLYEQIFLPIRAQRERITLLHSLGYVAPIFAPVPSIVTVHDLVFTYAAMSPVRRIALRIFVGSAMRTADCVVTDSDASRKEIVSYLRGNERKVVVVHLGGDHRVRSQSGQSLPSRERRYFLAFSSRSLSKNIGMLLTAFQTASTHSNFAHELVIVGQLRPEDARLAATIRGVLVTGQISDADVCNWLSSADYLVVPSTYEGFGLPVAEALCFGVPSLVSSHGSLPEVGGEAAIVFDPSSERDLVRLLVRVAADRPLRQEMARRAAARAALFTWASAARQMLDIYARWARRPT